MQVATSGGPASDGYEQGDSGTPPQHALVEAHELPSTGGVAEQGDTPEHPGAAQYQDPWLHEQEVQP